MRKPVSSTLSCIESCMIHIFIAASDLKRKNKKNILFLIEENLFFHMSERFLD